MEANAVPILDIFEKKMRLEVPLFQRQYVWDREQQWESLWEDIVRKFSEYMEGRRDAPVHFLGAMVLDQKQTPSTHVERRQVIDGQQRLTTLQIILSVFRDFCRENGSEDIASECDGYTFNKGMMAEPETDKFKVWPTQLDRSQFTDVISSGSRFAVEEKHPLTRRKYARQYDPRPRMVEAYLFFYDQLEEFVIGTSTDDPLLAEVPISQRLEECFHALKNAFQIVAIDLAHDDDAQVIFETLNARGEPLLPADLVRNYIFLRAARQGEPQEELYNTYWRRFDDEFWRVETKQGRLLRPRSDLFMQHFLASKLTTDIPVKHLYVEYKFWIEKQDPFSTVEDELAVLSRQGDDFRRIISPEKSDSLYGLSNFLDAYDVRTVYPLLLTVLDVKIDEAQLAAFARTLESYLLRRAVCGLTTKNYNRVFLSLSRNLRRDGVTHANLVKQITGLVGESVYWPSDDEFREAWKTTEIYHRLNNPKIVHILKRLNTTFIGDKMEDLSVESPLTLEHILPQDWVENWPLQDGSTGMTREELWDSEEDQVQAVVTRSRNSASHRIGNLTILGQALNSGVSNKSWNDKKPQLLQHSLLPINQQLHDHAVWDETTIAKRGDLLFQRAIELWPFA